MRREWKPEYFFDRTIRPMRLVGLAAPRRHSHRHPIRRAITGPAKTFRIDERLRKVDWVVIRRLPIIGKSSGHAPQKVRGQMGHADPGQNKKACIVREKADVAAACFRAPADVAVAAPQVPRRRTPRDTSNRTTFRPGQEFEMLPNWLFIAQVVMLFHQTVEQRLIRRSPHLL